VFDPIILKTLIGLNLLLFILPTPNGLLICLLFDCICNQLFFIVGFGGDCVLFQHLFWFFGHPEVYILILPCFSLILLCLCYCCILNYICNYCINLSLYLINVIGCFVWVVKF
jgi:heme/copper-type cytochrome/quinol oxidase subunit 1